MPGSVFGALWSDQKKYKDLREKVEREKTNGYLNKIQIEKTLQKVLQNKFL